MYRLALDSRALLSHSPESLLDVCHVPLFGGVAIILLSLARQLGEPRGWSVCSQYGMAFMGVAVLGALTEGVQSFSSTRFAEWSNLLLDVLGAVGTLGLYMTYDFNLMGRAAIWRLSPGKQHSGIRIEEPYPDWREFSRFQFEVYSELPSA
ncbi:MAG: hypothetical protein MRJ67_16360 [Nitrospirales bacterium]|nr:hypothetical protein [Nitrospirales bacterium]